MGKRFPTATSIYGIDICAVLFESSDASQQSLCFVQGIVRKLAGIHPHVQNAFMDLVNGRLMLCGMTNCVDTCAKCSICSDRAAGLGSAILSKMFSLPMSGANQAMTGTAYAHSALGGLHKGLDLDCGFNTRIYMEEAGFTDIQRWKDRDPILD